MFKRYRENRYKLAVRKTVSNLSGIPERTIPLNKMPKNDIEFEELITSTKDLAKLTWLKQ